MSDLNVPAPNLHSCSRQELVNVLAREIELDYGQELQRQPLVHEMRIAGTDVLQVVVLWERWGQVPPQERGPLILEAYEQSQPALLPKITAALGVTVQEALAMGLLPYRVVPARRKAGAVTDAQLRAALVKEGAIQTPRGLMLCFPSRKSAEDAVRRLAAHVPGPYWAIEAAGARSGAALG